MMYKYLKTTLRFFLAISYPSEADSEEIAINLPTVKLLMSAVGDVEVIPESLMNAAGAVSGSGPAYVRISFIINYAF